jgi:hypothetical protein
MDYIQDQLLWPDEYALAAEVRAVEEGHLARVLPDGSILVKSDSRPGSYLVRIRRVSDGVIGFSCTCPSGTYRPDRPVPCKHAALAGRRLEREGLAIHAAGHWRARARTALRAALAASTHPRRRRAAADSRAARVSRAA